MGRADIEARAEAASPMERLFKYHAVNVSTLHRLRYTHTEDEGVLTFVCLCGEGFSKRQNWNQHIEDAFGTLHFGELGPK